MVMLSLARIMLYGMIVKLYYPLFARDCGVLSQTYLLTNEQTDISGYRIAFVTETDVLDNVAMCPINKGWKLKNVPY